MPSLRIFGLTLQVQGDRFTPPNQAGVRLVYWNATISQATTLRFETCMVLRERFVCHLRCQLNLHQTASGDYAVTAGNQQQRDHNDAIFGIWDAPHQYQPGTTFPSDQPFPANTLPEPDNSHLCRVQANFLNFSFFEESTLNVPNGFVSARLLPGQTDPDIVFRGDQGTVLGGAPSRPLYEISTSADEFGVFIKLDPLQLGFTPGTFRALTASPHLLPGPQKITPLLFKQVIPSLPSHFDLSSDSWPLKFDGTTPPGGEQPKLHLHLQREDPSQVTANPSSDNPVLAAATVKEFHLESLLSVGVSGTIVNKINVQPPDGQLGFLLETHSYSKNDGGASVWLVGDPTDLAFSTVSKQNPKGGPSSFILAPTPAGGITVQRVASPDDQATDPSSQDFHGYIPNIRFRGTTGKLHVNHPDSGIPKDSSTDAGIQYALTSPHILIEAESGTASPTIRIPKGGEAFSPVADPTNGPPSTHDLAGGPVMLPLLASEWFHNYEDVRGQVLQEADANAIELSQPLQDAQHETSFKQQNPGGSNVSLKRLFADPPPIGGGGLSAVVQAQPASSLSPYIVTMDYGPIRVHNLNITPDKPPDYIILDTSTPFSQPPDPSKTWIEIGLGDPNQHINLPDTPFYLAHDTSFYLPDGGNDPKPRALAILKLSSKYSLTEIFNKERANHSGLDQAAGLDSGHLELQVDSRLTSQTWTGILLLNVKAGLSADNSIVATVSAPAASSLQIPYFALSPQKGGAPGFSTRILFSNPSNSSQEPTSRDPSSQETFFRLQSIDALWHNSNLLRLDIKGEQHFKYFFGLDVAQKLQVLYLQGSLNNDTHEFHMLASFVTPTSPNGLGLLPAQGWGPFQQVWISRAEVLKVKDNGGNPEIAVSIDGKIDLNNFGPEGGDWFSAGSKSVGFTGLRIQIPGRGDLVGVRAPIQYPSLNFDLSLPSFNFGLFALKIRGLQLDWAGLDWPPSIDLPGSNSGILPRIRFDLRLTIGKLPSLSLDPNGDLNLDFKLGFGKHDSLPGGTFESLKNVFRLAVTGINPGPFSISLLRFLEIDADSASITSKNGITYLGVSNLRVVVGGTTLIDSLYLYVFSSNNSKGFIAFYAAPNGGMHGFYWALIGYGVVIDPGLAARMMSVAIPESQESSTLAKDLQTAFDNQTILSGNGSGLHDGSWVLAAGFSFFGLFDGKFIYQEGAYFGIAIGGGFLKDWFGYDVAISVLYVRGATPEEDEFIASIRVPQFSPGAFQFTGGEVTFTVGPRTFGIDVGFPHLNSDGVSRQWYRAFGVICSPYQGSGGAYVLQRTLARSDENGMLVSGGFAVQFGLGISAGGGVFTVWATIGVYCIAEGDIFLGKKPDGKYELAGFELIAALGILVRAGAELNFWIISVRVEITLAVEARASLLWGEMPPASGGLPVQIAPSGHMLLRADFTFYASASAEACIGGGWFKICKSISVSVPVHVGFSLTF